MTEATPITAANFMEIINTIDSGIPKLKAFLVMVEANPGLVSIVSGLAPQFGAMVPLLLKLSPWLDFLQQLTDAIQAAEAQAAS